MKKIPFLLLTFMMLLGCMVMASCGDDDPVEPVTPVTISPQSISFTSAGGNQTVTVSDANPYVKPEESWIKAERTSSDANSAVYTITCEENTNKDARTGTVLFNNNKGGSVRLVVSQAGTTTKPEESEEQKKDFTFRTANEVAKDMYPGINLGNTLEAGNNAANWTNNGGLAYETYWQKTKTTQAVINYYKEQGFKSVRIPVAWVMGHVTDASSVKIDTKWMARVKEIVDYCINAGLYVIINDHWDGGWLEENVATYDATRASQLKALWTNIANEFQNYDEHLLFAGLNEPNADNQTKTTNLIKYEQDFVDAVRATGGNNEKRILVVQGPNTDIDNTSKYYTALPADKTPNAMMMELHFYPYQFCMMTKDESWGKQVFFWGAENHVSGEYSAYNGSSEESWVLSQFKKMKTQFVDKGCPVVLGEYGVIWRTLKNSSPAIAGDEYQTKHNNSVKLFHKVVNQYAIQCGIVPFVWDTNGLGSNSMDVINRSSLSIFNSHAIEGIKEGVAAASWGGK